MLMVNAKKQYALTQLMRLVHAVAKI